MKRIFPSACCLALLAGCTSQMDDSQPVAYSPHYFSSEVETPPVRWNSQESADAANAQEAMALRQLAVAREQQEGAYQSVTETPSITPYDGSGSVTYAPPPPRTPETPQPQQLSPPVVGEQRTGPAPIATPVPGKPGYVLSPFAPQAGYVDVSGLAPGTEAKDPYTGKIFRVP